MSSLKFEKNELPKFELVLQIRDHEGKPTGKTKSFSTDDAEQLDNYFQRNSGTKKTRKKKEDKKIEEKTQ